MTQRTKEWLELSKEAIDYHKRQYENTYRSTIAFCDWLEALGCIDSGKKLSIIDIGTGAGANVYYMAKRYNGSNFLGVELNFELVNIGNEIISQYNPGNCKLEQGDLYNLDKEYIGKFDGVVSYQTLMGLPDYKAPLEKMIELKPKWIAMTSLFYDGDINCRIEVQDYFTYGEKNKYRENFYNIYSINLIKELLCKKGYSDIKYIPFEIDIDLKKPDTKGMGTYTEKLTDGRRLQISGPLLMPWYFIYAHCT